MNKEKSKTVTVVIPVRAGSKGFPKKNIAQFNGESLYMTTINFAVNCGASRVIVTTDEPEILKRNFAAISPKIEILERPAELCQDDSRIEDVISHCILSSNIVGIILFLQVTSPLRAPSDFEAVMDTYLHNDYSLVITVSEAERSVLKWGFLDGIDFKPISGNSTFCFANRQSLPSIFKPNGAFYLFDSKVFISNGGFSEKRIGAVKMPPSRSIDIDSVEDLKAAGLLINSNKE